MFLRFQIRSDVFAQIVRAELRRSDAGCIEPGADGIAVERLDVLPLGPAPVSLASTSVGLVVNRAGSPPVVVQRHPLQVTLPVRMVARTLDNWAKGVAEPGLTFTLNVRLGVDFVIAGTKVAPRITYQGLADDPSTPDAIEQAVDARLRSGGLDRTLDSFDLVDNVFSLLANLGSSTAPKICWTGISLSSDGQTVEIRLELTTGDASGTHDIGAWQAFLGQQFDDRREGLDLAVAVPQELVVDGARSQVAAELASQSDFDLTSGPDIAWDASKPGLHVTLSGTQIDACQCLWGEIDIDVDVAIDIAIGAEDTPEGGNLVLDQRRDVDVQDDLAVACCFVTWPFDKIVTLIGDIPEFVVDVISLPLRTLTASWDQPGGSGPPPPPDPCTEDPDDEDHKVCRYPLGLNPVPDRCHPQALRILRPRVRGFADSLVLQCGAQVRELALPVPSVGPIEAFVWHPPTRDCSGVHGEWQASSSFHLAQGGGDLRLEVKQVIPVTGTGAAYKTALTGSPACPLAFDARVDVSVLAGFVNGIPTPGHVLVLTTGGNLLVNLPPVPARDQTKVDAFTREYPLWRVANCYIDQDDWPGAFDPHWLVDPPWEDTVAHQLWIIRAGALEAGQRVVVRNGDQVLATAVAASEGTVGIELVHPASQLTIERQSATGRTMPGERYGLTVKQVLLGQVGHQRTATPIHALGPAPHLAVAPGLAHVTVLTIGELVTYALAASPASAGAGAPVAEVVDVSTVPALIGGQVTADGFVGTAANGSQLRITRLPIPSGAARRQVSPFWVDEVIDLTSPIETTGLGHSNGARGARHLVAAALATGAVAGPRSGVQLVERRVLDGDRYGVDLGDGGFVVGSTSIGEGTTSYAARPWSDGTVRVGRVYVRLDDDRQGFRWFVVGGTATY